MGGTGSVAGTIAISSICRRDNSRFMAKNALFFVNILDTSCSLKLTQHPQKRSKKAPPLSSIGQSKILKNTTFSELSSSIGQSQILKSTIFGVVMMMTHPLGGMRCVYNIPTALSFFSCAGTTCAVVRDPQELIGPTGTYSNIRRGSHLWAGCAVSTRARVRGSFPSTAPRSLIISLTHPR